MEGGKGSVSMYENTRPKPSDPQKASLQPPLPEQLILKVVGCQPVQSNSCTFQRRVNRFNLGERNIRKSGGGREEEEPGLRRKGVVCVCVWGGGGGVRGALKTQHSSAREGP